MPQPIWKYIADIISGRVHNTLVKQGKDVRDLKRRITQKENVMTQTEQAILNAAHQIEQNTATIKAAFDALNAKLVAAPTFNEEDVAEELALLSNALGGQTALAAAMRSIPEGTEETTEAEGVADPTIDYENNPSIPLAGESGPTDAGTPTTVPAPGVPDEDPVINQPAEDATAEANPELSPADPIEAETQPATPSDDDTTPEGPEDDDSQIEEPVTDEETPAGESDENPDDEFD